ncbi:MAG TPA: LuxR C-terminal-related transcriptional regulator [Anaeromyxobacter sp.]|nr:LuxR C-terminal-related transcriptional regulator [Anaeromyxobacter sp.]
MRALRDPTDQASLNRMWIGMSAVLGVTLLVVGADLALDVLDGDHLHVLLDLLIGVLALGGIAAMTIRLGRSRRRTQALQGRLRAAEDEAQRFRDESRAYLRGLAEAIDRQLTRWALSPAEREVVLLLLKGLSHKEIGAIRECSERTIRHQARVAYKKAGLAGRVELAAFFLEDLLVAPSPVPERTFGEGTARSGRPGGELRSG